MVLWSLARTAALAPVFRDAEYFAVNVLAKGDAALSSHFAKPSEDKFAAFPDRFTPGTGRQRRSCRGAVATFECHSRHRYYGGDHIIVIGNVERYVWSEQPPLIFGRGRYL